MVVLCRLDSAAQPRLQFCPIAVFQQQKKKRTQENTPGTFFFLAYFLKRAILTGLHRRHLWIHYRDLFRDWSSLRKNVSRVYLTRLKLFLKSEEMHFFEDLVAN